METEEKVRKEVKQQNESTEEVGVEPTNEVKPEEQTEKTEKENKSGKPEGQSSLEYGFNEMQKAMNAFETRQDHPAVKVIAAIARHAWKSVPFLLLIGYVGCVYTIRNILEDLWSFSERVIVYYITFHYVYFVLFWAFFKCHFTPKKLITMNYERVCFFSSS